MDENDYELLDAGDGRRLERFGPHVVDRPAVAADGPIRDPATWSQATIRFDRYAGWEPAGATVEPWSVRLAGLTFELRATDTGQVGLFPEQAPNWRWLRERVGAAAAGDAGVSVVNLFAYTGASTLAAAAAGASVAHVDASRPAVGWARRNAELSDLAGKPVRWLVDDGEAFIARELRRGRRYDGFVLDPPSYGHGAGGRTWRLEERLDPLLAACAAVASAHPFVVLTAHTPGFAAARLADAIGAAFGAPRRDVDAGDLVLSARSGARLALGSFARWPRSGRSRPR